MFLSSTKDDPDVTTGPSFIDVKSNRRSNTYYYYYNILDNIRQRTIIGKLNKKSRTYSKINDFIII